MVCPLFEYITNTIIFPWIQTRALTSEFQRTECMLSVDMLEICEIQSFCNLAERTSFGGVFGAANRLYVKKTWLWNSTWHVSVYIPADHRSRNNAIACWMQTVVEKMRPLIIIKLLCQSGVRPKCHVGNFNLNVQISNVRNPIYSHYDVPVFLPFHKLIFVPQGCARALLWETYNPNIMGFF